MIERDPGSFRDPSGFMFVEHGTLYRQVNPCYRETGEALEASGLWRELMDRGWMVRHEDVTAQRRLPDGAWRILKPEPVPFLSYPHEWCFSQLQDAALLTLKIHRKALKHGFVLKDASAYNIQFVDGKPLLIDTLSFDRYQEGSPWVAYRQFCQHFLAPLALMAYGDARLNRLFQCFIDGVPLDLASRLLPRRTRFKLGLGLHLHAHARSQRRHADQGADGAFQARTVRISRQSMLGLIDSLKTTVAKLGWKPAGTEWGDYYRHTNYSDAAFADKKRRVEAALDRVQPATVWDLGGNTGVFSRIASQRKIPTVCFDVDPAAVEANYRQIKASGETHLLPLLQDLTNPSPGMGWRNRERRSLAERQPAGLCMALALIHHLAIGNNVPLASCARFFHDLSPYLLIEFVPKEDSQVQRLLRTREDIFPDYTEAGFLRAFEPLFEPVDSWPVEGSVRRLFLFRART